jgi:nicotinamidase-related amidase
MTTKIGLSDKARPFLHYLDEWYEHLTNVTLANIVGDTPEQVALFIVDMVNGFCKEGPLAGQRVGALIVPVREVAQRAYELGVRAFILPQDTHDPNTPEFEAYPPHCIAGTPECQTVSEIQALPFSNEMMVLPKNSLSADIGTTLREWMQEHQQVSTFIVIGDCTDLCVYSAAMFLRLDANAHNLKRRVIVPANAVETFDTPISVAHDVGIRAHDGDLHHILFLHHMALNGIEVVAKVL